MHIIQFKVSAQWNIRVGTYVLDLVHSNQFTTNYQEMEMELLGI